jgi:hypothetical protein
MSEAAAMPSPRPLALSDSEIAHVMSAARVLPIGDRDEFLRSVAATLQSQPVLGDGIVARVCRELQQRYWRPPELDERPLHGGKYGR